MRALDWESSDFLVTAQKPLFSEQTAHMAAKSMLLWPAPVFTFHWVTSQGGSAEDAEWSLSKHVLNEDGGPVYVCDLCDICDFTDYHTCLWPTEAYYSIRTCGLHVTTHNLACRALNRWRCKSCRPKGRERVEVWKEKLNGETKS